MVSIIILLIFLLAYKHWSKTSESTNQPEELGIKTLLEKVKDELYKAEEERLKTDSATPFEFDKLDLEINFVVKTNNKANAEIKLVPITVGGQTEYSSEKVQKITLHLVAAKPQQYFEEKPQEKDFDGDEEIIDHTAPNSEKKGDKK